MHDVWSFTGNRRRMFTRIHEYRARQPNAERSIPRYRYVLGDDHPWSGGPERLALGPGKEVVAGCYVGGDTSGALDLYGDLAV